MDFKEFQKLTEHPDAYSAEDVEELRLLSEEELQKYQTEVELHDGDNLSGWEHLLAFFTLKKKLMDIQEAQKNHNPYDSEVVVRPNVKRVLKADYALDMVRVFDPERIEVVTFANDIEDEYTVWLKSGASIRVQGDVNELFKHLNWDVTEIENTTKKEGDKK